MATEAELSFKVAEAKHWKEDVTAEIEAVNLVLKNVATEVETEPYEDDTIMMGLKSAGEALKASFELLNSNFVKAVSGIDPIISNWNNMIQNLLQGLSETVSKVGQRS